MKLNINNVPQDNILIFDIEYDQNVLIQLATLTLRKIESDVFQLTRSTNTYIDPNQSVSSFFMGYTNITNDYLRHNGTDLAGVRSLAHEVVFDVGTNNTLLVSHGLDNDLEILYKNGIDWKTLPNKYDTYKKAKELLQRGSLLTLKDIAQNDGFFMFNEHNAYADAWGTLHAFCWLKENEERID